MKRLNFYFTLYISSHVYLAYKLLVCLLLCCDIYSTAGTLQCLGVLAAQELRNRHFSVALCKIPLSMTTDNSINYSDRHNSVWQTFVEKTKKAVQGIFVHTLRRQWSLSVIKPNKSQDYPGASQVRAYRAEGLITQLKFHCPLIPEISFQKEKIWGLLLPIFLQVFILFWFSPLISKVSSVFLYDIPSLPQRASLASTKMFKGLQPS